MSQPVLSIGIIFKNEIRCLERCLQSFQALRAAVPCELVMADTGSTDGSREIAEKYADILFDFPWINDFAAARNAVMDRCSGFWYLTVDADEWLDEDITELTAFLNNRSQRGFTGVGVMVRNFLTEDFAGDSNDFFAIRIARMDTGARYVGAIHEHWEGLEHNLLGLAKTILKHDGYVGGSSVYAAKKKRNMELLKAELEQNPNKTSTLLQAVESSAGTSEHGYYILRAAAAVEEKREGWEEFGPPIMRYAANAASLDMLPDFQAWVSRAKEWFPDSPFTTIDVACLEFCNLVKDEAYAQAIPVGEAYLRSLKNYKEGRFDVRDIFFSTLMMAAKSREEQVRYFLANAYFAEKRFQEAKEMLLTLEPGKLEVGSIGNYLGIMLNLHAQSGLDMSSGIADFWNQITAPVPDEARAEQRKKAALATAQLVFEKGYRDSEDGLGFRHAYTLFLPLKNTCETGRGAAILESYSRPEIEELLERVENWEELPISALAHALEFGVSFPLEDRPLNIEETDQLISRLTHEPSMFASLIRQIMHEPVPEDMQKLVWTRGIAIAAIQVLGWKAEGSDAELGLDAARLFARTEGLFLPRCFAAEVLRAENLFILPPLHRFGWCCVQAFAALDAGDTAGYVRLLRDGLSSCEGMKPMVEFLLDHTPELHAPTPADELCALAEQVRAVLSRFAPDDPAVEMLKQSEAYQKVACLIEGTQPPIVGGQLQ